MQLIVRTIGGPRLAGCDAWGVGGPRHIQPRVRATWRLAAPSLEAAEDRQFAYCAGGEGGGVGDLLDGCTTGGEFEDVGFAAC